MNKEKTGKEIGNNEIKRRQETKSSRIERIEVRKKATLNKRHYSEKTEKRRLKRKKEEETE